MSFPRRLLRSASLAVLATAMAFAAGLGRAQNVLPTNGAVTSGAASIRSSGASLTVTQTSPRAIVNWGSFSIGSASAVDFNQPNASSAILNRVTGSARSTLAGSLQANGQVFLVNPNGIAITPTGAVQVGGGFVASTLGIADSDFMSGNLRFSGNGASAGVSNAGSIKAAPGGFVGLLGGTISNAGVVDVPLGKVGIGSGEQATLNLTGDNFLQVAVPTNARTADGQSLIDMSGKVRAAGGSVQLEAATVANAIRNAINVPGELTVTSARVSGGSIILSGGPGGDVAVAGRLSASGRTKGGAIAIDGHNVALRRAKLAASSAKGRGGSITVTGTNAVGLVAASIDASGATGGGAIRVGGDFHGASDVTSAQATTIDSASTLNASAMASGDGGTVAVWSNGTTTFAGEIAATGGPNGGNGGYVEVSANPATRGILGFTGDADLTAPKGKTGTLLLDPYNVTIYADESFGGSFSVGNPSTWTPTASSFIDNTELGRLLATSNVIVTTGGLGSPGTDAGNITVSAQVAWTSNNSLTLDANNNIVLNQLINGAGPLIDGAGPLVLNAGNGIVQNLGGAVTASSVVATAGAGGIVLNDFINSTGNVSLQASGDIVETTSAFIAAPLLVATSSGGAVVLASFNDVASVSGSAPQGFSFFNDADLSVGGITTTTGPIYLAAESEVGGTITQTGRIAGPSLYVVASADVKLNGAVNSVATISGSAVGEFDFTNASPTLTVGPVSYYTSTATATPQLLTSPAGISGGNFDSNCCASVVVSTTGNLVLGSGSNISNVAPGDPPGNIVLAATGSFTNNAGPTAVTTPNANWQIYSASPTGDAFGGLDSGQTAVWNTAFNGTVTPTTVNRYLFAFRPTITITSDSLAKTFGQDVTALVAANYTISGLQPGVQGAFLPDTLSAVTSGTPSVTSLGSPATASFARSPYPITVAQGAFTVSDGYGLVLNSAGRLTVAAFSEPNDFVPGLTEINNPARSEWDVGGFEQVLPHFAVNCNEPPSLPDPNRISDPDAALRAISQAMENYFRRCQNPTQETIANALDAYSAKLEILAPRLPPALRNVPAIVAEGARRVRAARSRTEAVAVLRQTIAAVHKDIALVLSEDQETRSREVRDGDVIAGALDGATATLVNSGGL